MREITLVVEKYPAGYVAYPLGLVGVVVGQGATHQEAVDDALSAVRFHVETFGRDVLNAAGQPLEAYVEREPLGI